MLVLRRELERGTGQAVVVAVQDPGVLDAAVGVGEARTDGADTFQLRIADQRRQPARIADLGVVVQEQNVVRVDGARGDVVHVRKREARPGVRYVQDATGQ